MAPAVGRELTATVTVCNRTNSPLSVVPQHASSDKTSVEVLARARAVLTHRSFIDLDGKARGADSPFGLLLGPDGGPLCQLSIPWSSLRSPRSSLSQRSAWRSLAASADHKAKVKVLYRSRHVAYASSTFVIDLLILPSRDPATFMSTLNDRACLTSLCVPGTHESLALYGWPISTCQAPEASVTQQLADGARYLDIRLAPKGLPGKERLLAFHGITDERIEFGKVLQECFDFLDGAGKDETIIMSIKQEQGDQDLFIRLLFEEYVYGSASSKATSHSDEGAAGSQRWFLEDRVPTLGEVRGKIVMLSRFVIHPSYGFPGGISPPIWPNSVKGGFEYALRGSHQLVQTQDWYDIGYLSRIPEKMSYIEKLCRESGRRDDVLSLNYCNGSSFPFALPPAVAKGFLHDGTRSYHEEPLLTRLMATEGVNWQLRNFVADVLFEDDSVSLRGRLSAVDMLKVTFAIDYYNEPAGASDLFALLIEANF